MREVFTIDALAHDIGEYIGSLGVYFLGLQRSGGKRGGTLEVFVDTESGVTADELANVSRALSEWLDARAAVEEQYSLIVSSPGLDEPLRFGWQYRRHKGRTIRIEYDSNDNPAAIEGIIDDCSEEAVTVLVAADERQAVPLASIRRAVVVPSFRERGIAPKPARKNAKQQASKTKPSRSQEDS